jgi:predicted amidophosphoribosyltransferase
VIENEPDVKWLDEIDLVVPMPGDPWRTWKRGFNPARLIAKEIVRTTKRPLAHPRWFTRTGSKPQQALSMDERSKRYEENVFRLDKRYFGQAERVKCLLVDDVATTGATLRAATAALTASGLTVEALVLSVGL